MRHVKIRMGDIKMFAISTKNPFIVSNKNIKLFEKKAKRSEKAFIKLGLSECNFNKYIKMGD